MNRKTLLTVFTALACAMPIMAQTEPAADPFDEFNDAPAAPPTGVPVAAPPTGIPIAAPAQTPAPASAVTPQTAPQTEVTAETAPPSAAETATPSAQTADPAPAQDQDAQPAPAQASAPDAPAIAPEAATATAPMVTPPEAVPPAAPRPANPMAMAYRAYVEAREAIKRGDPEFAAYVVAQTEYEMRMMAYEMETGERASAPDSSLASAMRTLAAAWELIGVTRQDSLPPADTSAVSGDTVSAAAVAAAPAVPVAADTAAPVSQQVSALPPPSVKPSDPMQLSLGMIFTPTRFFGTAEPQFRPWWVTGIQASYRELDINRGISSGFGVDFSLMFFSRKPYDKYHRGLGERDSIELTDVRPLFIADLGYYAKWYPMSFVGSRVFNFTAMAGVSGTLGGSANTSYILLDENGEHTNRMQDVPEDLIRDTYVLKSAVGLGFDIPIPTGLPFDVVLYGEWQYSLRLGIQSILKNEDNEIKMGGFIQQTPIRFGLMIPLRAEQRK